jgi:tetratricopeptide (TPR) repeat protein
MEQAAGHALDRDDVDLAQAIHDETEGNPFFVREVFRHLTETGFIERRGGRWTTRLPVADVGIPESVRDVVGRRLSRLSERANRVLRVASVIGAEFDLPIVSTAAGLDEDSVLSAMEEAGGARLVLEASGVVNRYRFAHALVRDTLYEELSASRRVSLHRQVAEALEAVHAATLDDHLAALAHHWSRASAPAADTTRAVDYATRAGDKALRQLAHDEAVTYYREALELREVAGSGPDRQHCTLMISLGEAQRRAGDPAHRETLLRAGRLARQLNDTELLARAALANQRVLFSRLGAVDADRVQAFEVALEAVGPRDSPERARLLAALASELHFAGEERRKVELGREGLAIARRLGDTFTLADAIVALWFAVLDPTTVSERSHLADELVAISERIGDPSLEFHAGFIKFFTGSEQGDMAVADSGLATCMRVADEVGLPVLRWRAAILQCHRAYIDGRLDDIERWSKEGERLGEEAGQPDASAFSDVFVVRILQGRPGEAVELARPLVETYRDSPVYRSGLAWACAEAGQLVEARSLLAEVRGAGFADLPRDYLWLLTLVVLGRTSARLAAASEAAELYELLRPHHSAIALGQSTWLGPVAYDLGLLATTLGRYADADAHFAEAVETDIRMRLRGMLAQSYLEWSRMLLTRREPGDAERARELLGHAVVTARELGLANIERQAGSFLGDCA